MQKTALDNVEYFSDVQKYVECKIYMDDLYFPTNSLKKTQNLLQGMTNVLSKGCSNLIKRSSSSPEFLKSLEIKIRLHPDNALPQNQRFTKERSIRLLYD